MNKNILNSYIIRKIKIGIVLSIFVIVSQNNLNGQNRYDQLKLKLDLLANEIPALEETVDVSVNGLSIHEFIRGVANSVFLNISIDLKLDFKIVNNFSNVKVKDVLLFLCKEYDLEITAIGNILSLTKYEIPEVARPKPTKKSIIIEYNSSDDLLSIDFNNDSLPRVSKEITDVTGKNLILAPGLKDKLVSAYIKEMPFKSALEKFAFANGLKVTKTTDDYYLISKDDELPKITDGSKKVKKGVTTSDQDRNADYSSFYYKIRGIDNISIRANYSSIHDLIKLVSDSLEVNYSIVSEIEGETNLNISNMCYEEFLVFTFDGTKYSFSKKDGVYIIGEKDNLALQTSNTIQLQHRTVESIVEYIPDDLKNDVGIIEFPELNSLLINGSTFQIDKLKSFIKSIDKVVPVILIEIIIVDINKSHTVATGIKAGVEPTTEQTGQTILPGVDYKLSTVTLNNFIDKINGFGWINLGQVSPDFYFIIKALEDNGALKVRSTPKLSTLNGHEATLSVGETKYYKEERNNFIGTQNPQLASSSTWKSIDADLAVKIKPIVSGDDQITLEIEVQQSEFTPREFEGAPPGSVTRNFKSLIRVKNQEMILLGGLDKVTSQDLSQGIPLLSRIPVLKWFFSSKTKSKSEGKLNIFIQPTIIY